MDDQESQEISASGGSSENTHNSPKTIVHLTGEAKSPQEKFDFLTRNVEGITARVNIHKSLLDIGNYFFAFQRVCLAAISNTSLFVCDNAWFITFLCILAAIPNLASHEWISLMDRLDARLKEMDIIQNVVEEEQN